MNHLNLFLRSLLSFVLLMAGESVLGSHVPLKKGTGVQDEFSLVAGKPVSRHLAAGVVNLHKIGLPAPNYINLIINPRGIDIVVKLYDSKKNLIYVADSAGKNEGEKIYLISATPETYQLEVRTARVDGSLGSYSINLREVKQPTATDVKFTKAMSIFSEGHFLHKLLNEESARSAIRKFEEAGNLCRELLDTRCEAQVLHYAGKTYDWLGEEDKALDVYYRSIELYEKVKDLKEVRTVLNRVAYVYNKMGEYNKSLELHFKVLSMQRAAGNQGSSTLSNIGSIYYTLGDWNKSLQYNLESLSILERDRKVAEMGQPYNSAGEAYLKLGQPDKALDFFNRSIKSWKLEGKLLGEAFGLRNIGDVYASRKEHEMALKFYTEALNKFQEIVDKHAEARTLFHMAKVYLEVGSLSKSRELVERAISIVEKFRSRIIARNLRASYFTTVKEYYDFYIDLLMLMHQKSSSVGHDIQALHASERARARTLLEMLTEAQVDIRAGADPKLLMRERDIHRQIEATYERQKNFPLEREEEEAIKRELIDLTRENERVQAQIKESNPRLARLTQPEPLGVDQIKRLLGNNTVLLEFYLGTNRSFLWMVTRNELKSFVLPAKKEIEQASTTLYGLLTSHLNEIKGETVEEKLTRVNRARSDYSDSAARLSSILFDQLPPIRAEQRILIVSDGALHYVPFSILSLPHTGAEPMVVNHEVLTIPSASTLAVIRKESTERPKASRRVYILADPVFSRNDIRLRRGGRTKSSVADNSTVRIMSNGPRSRFERLEYTRELAEEILRKTPHGQGTAALDLQANRKTATSEELVQYQVVIFATHGLLNNEHPELSGIVLSMVDERGNPQDGFLRLHDIYKMRLRADLVVLAACETGLGKEIRGEGLVGLTRGFMYAGASRVMASLWKVDQYATVELVRNVYETMARENCTPSYALRKAQIAMWKSKRWSFPFYWSGFVIHGDL
jgi:CHAT domain-containing protein/tetratricopeptide (TPR) repeat protein